LASTSRPTGMSLHRKFRYAALVSISPRSMTSRIHEPEKITVQLDFNFGIAAAIAALALILQHIALVGSDITRIAARAFTAIRYCGAIRQVPSSCKPASCAYLS